MRILTLLALCLTILLSPLATTPAFAATPAEIATQVRTNWANAKSAYLNAVKPYAANNATLISQYSAALDKAGGSLENFLTLKQQSPAPSSTTMTAAVDQLAKDLLTLRGLTGKATGGLATALSSALTQQNQVAQTALANMR
ncbi:hypothetical protein EZJ19_09375 [Parasulfuritortus cantonensis]|uniref:Uncharacterized protein n=1 Tax=Parasulfuritortus cantonensis TaxID=2528202 RepID=A0A4R1BC85_9PROT|nr:hypothetical protein [Parasulfuritortus cantonensis]TCJ14649.1 hypothetical protein EZJ19_09375 [Parasulfuritortus cantonensis]